jgi:hypothetical protein
MSGLLRAGGKQRHPCKALNIKEVQIDYLPQGLHTTQATPMLLIRIPYVEAPLPSAKLVPVCVAIHLKLLTS